MRRSSKGCGLALFGCGVSQKVAGGLSLISGATYCNSVGCGGAQGVQRSSEGCGEAQKGAA